MAGVGNKVKLTLLKGMEAIGQTASSLASNAQQKLQELNLENQRREILTDFPLRAYDLWQKGEALPEALSQMLKELSELDERLGVLRAQRYAKVESEHMTQAEAEEGVDDANIGIAAGDQEADELSQAAPEGEDGKADELPEVQDQTMQNMEAVAEPMDKGETGDNA